MRSTLLFVPLFLLPSCSSTTSGTGYSTNGTLPNDPGGSLDNGTSSSAPAATYDALFGPPENSSLTEDSLTGVWAGTVNYVDTRVKMTATSLTIAKRCSSSTVGLDIAAQVSDSAIRIVESKDTPSGGSCATWVRPANIHRCSTEPLYDAACFELKGTSLKFRSSTPLFRDAEFTKLSD